MNRDQSEEEAQLMDVSTDLPQLNNLIKRDLTPLLKRKAETGLRFDHTFSAGIATCFQTARASLGKGGDVTVQ